MANVSEEDLSSGFIVPSDSTYTFTKVIDSADFSYTDGGWQTHSFNTPFAWNGTSNLLVVVKRDHGTYSYGATSMLTMTVSQEPVMLTPMVLPMNLTAVLLLPLLTVTLPLLSVTFASFLVVRAAPPRST